MNPEREIVEVDRLEPGLARVGVVDSWFNIFPACCSLALAPARLANANANSAVVLSSHCLRTVSICTGHSIHVARSPRLSLDSLSSRITQPATCPLAP